MKVDFDPNKVCVVAGSGTVVREVTGQAVYAVARWLAHSWDGDPEGYEITGEHGTFRIHISTVEPDTTPYA